VSADPRDPHPLLGGWTVPTELVIAMVDSWLADDLASAAADALPHHCSA
jgi:hypothetical protein